MASLDRLPQEVLHLVCSQLPSRDARSFRLVCRALMVVGSSYAFRELILYSHHKDFAFLGRLLSNPVISRSVRSLRYHGMLYDHDISCFRGFARRCFNQDLEDRSWSYGTPDDTGHSIRRRPQPSGDLLKSSYSKYIEALNDQTVMIEDQSDFVFFANALRELPTLEDITVTTVSPRKPWWIPNSPFREDSVFLLPGRGPFPLGYRYVEALIHGLKTRPYPGTLRSLHAEGISWRFFDQSPSALAELGTMFSNLANFQIRIKTNPRDDGPAKADVLDCRKFLSESRALSNFLAYLGKLERLGVEFTSRHEHHYDDDAFPTTLDCVLAPGHVWTQLRSLKLGNILSNRHDFLKALVLQRNTLIDLELSNISLGITSWCQLLPGMKTNLRLQRASIHCRLCGMSDGENEDWEVHFVSPLRDGLSNYLTDRTGSIACPLTFENSLELQRTV
ncbi:hypothetical protein B0J13DRAFT_656611 [Dactylonectria estremocensis]|uniref:F-box domain-containing protein n=1 Tax=Dactylonectria estremocensis TaxID=1079267 RepID=A0A9P9IBT8_9HYPO|nr:hypothetical protein B0J13DRAFT_656611 [Dactylonectria estremocensis]